MLTLARALAAAAPACARQRDRPRPAAHQLRQGDAGRRGHPAAAEVARPLAKAPFTTTTATCRAARTSSTCRVSSQVLVFSKTSLQRDRIAPKTPRAIYFNDDVYVGFCLRGDVMEVSAADPKLGTVFYTLDQEPAERPRFDAPDRQLPDLPRLVADAAACRGTWSARCSPTATAMPILSAGHRTASTTPARWSERWGGWYVTGTHGKQTHMGNLVVRGRRAPPRTDNARRGRTSPTCGRLHRPAATCAAQRHRRADGAGAPGRDAQPARPRDTSRPGWRCTTRRS